MRSYKGDGCVDTGSREEEFWDSKWRAYILRIEHGGLLQDWESYDISITKCLVIKMQYTILKEINCSIL